MKEYDEHARPSDEEPSKRGRPVPERGPHSWIPSELGFLPDGSSECLFPSGKEPPPGPNGLPLSPPGSPTAGGPVSYSPLDHLYPPTPDELRPVEHAYNGEHFAQAEASEALLGTFKAIINYAIDLVADAHGLGLLLRGAKLVLAAAKWLQVGTGARQIDIGMPIPLGSGFELDLSAHMENSPNDPQPPITFCFAPSVGPDPGVLVADGCLVSPGDMTEEASADEDRQAGGRAEERGTDSTKIGAVGVDIDLSGLMSGEGNPRVRTAALMCLAENHLLPALKQQQMWETLKAEEVECVIYYDQKSKNSVWLFLGNTEKHSISVRVVLDSSGELAPWRK